MASERAVKATSNMPQSHTQAAQPWGPDDGMVDSRNRYVGDVTLPESV